MKPDGIGKATELRDIIDEKVGELGRLRLNRPVLFLVNGSGGTSVQIPREIAEEVKWTVISSLQKVIFRAEIELLNL